MNPESSKITGGQNAQLIPIQENKLKHNKRGLLSMVVPNKVAEDATESSCSHFFITLDEQESLDSQRYTVFGEVIDGWDVLAKIEQTPVAKG